MLLQEEDINNMANELSMNASFVPEGKGFILPDFSNLPMIQSNMMLKLAQLKKDEEDKQKIIDLKTKEYETNKSYIDARITESLRKLGDDRAISYGEASEALGKDASYASKLALLKSYSNDDTVKNRFVPDVFLPENPKPEDLDAGISMLSNYAKAKRDPIAKERILGELDAKIKSHEAGNQSVYTREENGYNIVDEMALERDKTIRDALQRATTKVPAPSTSVKVDNITPADYSKEKEDSQKIQNSINTERNFQEVIKKFGKGSGSFAGVKMGIGNLFESIGLTEQSKVVRDAKDLAGVKSVVDGLTLENLKPMMGGQLSEKEAERVTDYFGTIKDTQTKMLFLSRLRKAGMSSKMLSNELGFKYITEDKGVDANGKKIITNPVTAYKRAGEALNFNKIAIDSKGDAIFFDEFLDKYNKKYDEMGLNEEDRIAKWMLFSDKWSNQ